MSSTKIQQQNIYGVLVPFYGWFEDLRQMGWTVYKRFYPDEARKVEMRRQRRRRPVARNDTIRGRKEHKDLEQIENEASRRISHRLDSEERKMKRDSFRNRISCQFSTESDDDDYRGGIRLPDKASEDSADDLTNWADYNDDQSLQCLIRGESDDSTGPFQSKLKHSVSTDSDLKSVPLRLVRSESEYDDLSLDYPETEGDWQQLRAMYESRENMALIQECLSDHERDTEDSGELSDISSNDVSDQERCDSRHSNSDMEGETTEDDASR